MTPPQTAITAASFLQGLIGQMMNISVGGQASHIAGTLDQIAEPLRDLGRGDLSTRLGHVSNALRSGDYQRTDWLQSRLYGELADVHAALARGDSFEEAVKTRRAQEKLSHLVGPIQTNFTSVAARPRRATVGPAPRIEWAHFGTPEHPAPRPPSAGVTSAGKRLSYFFHYVAGHATEEGESETAIERFYEITPDLRRRIRDGRFAPKALGQFPAQEAQRLIEKAMRIEPLYGQLMSELILQSVFEAQGWSMAAPTERSLWTDSLLFTLRRHVAAQLTERKTGILEDRDLIRVVRNLVNLESVNWHPGRTRREVFEPWLAETQRRSLGDGILRSLGWQAPSKEASDDLQFQWRVRHWIAHYHYGALPARGLPYPTETVLRFAFARIPKVQSDFRRGLLKMMKET